MTSTHALRDEDLKGRLTVRVWPDAGRMLGLGKDATYAAVARGEIPSIRCGRRILIPVGKLRALLGADA